MSRPITVAGITLEVVLGGAALQHAHDHEGKLSQPVDGAQLLTRSHASQSI